jgi:hypothetical protein
LIPLSRERERAPGMERVRRQCESFATQTRKHAFDEAGESPAMLVTTEPIRQPPIAELFDPEAVRADLCTVRDRDDDVPEGIYIGRQFRNDTGRLEKLFEPCTRMAAQVTKPPAAGGRCNRAASSARTNRKGNPGQEEVATR